MPIFLRDSSGRELELPVSPDLADALFARASAALTRCDRSQLGEIAAQRLLELLLASEGSDAHPPSPAQIKFALDIVRRLGVDLPAGALHDRLVMGSFLSRYGDRLRGRPFRCGKKDEGSGS